MNAGKRKIAMRWFGYQKRDTDAYLRKLESMQRQESEEIEAKLREQRTVNEQLKAKADQLKQKTIAAPLPSNKFSLLLERLERSVDAIERQGEAEADQLRRLLERKRDRHDQRMLEWDKQFGDYRTALDFLMDEAAAMIAKVKEKQEPEPIEQLEREAEQAMQAVPEHKHEEVIEEREEVLEEEKQVAGAQEAHSISKVLQFKLRSILSEAAAAEEGIQVSNTSMTADGMRVESSAGLIESPAKPAPAPVKQNSPKTSSSFWGDLDPYLDEPEVYTTAEITGYEPTEVLPKDEPATFDAKVTEAEQTSIESPGLSDEILSIQNRYIVGKAAGENLYAASGQIIIAKGQIITAEIVQSAEREGKLPDLIVHMVIPGFGANES